MSNPATNHAAELSKSSATKLGLDKLGSEKLALAPLLPADSEDSALTLLLKQYLKPQDIAQVWEGYRYAFKAHDGVVRKTGEPYIIHPVSVACILAELHMDIPTIMAAL